MSSLSRMSSHAAVLRLIRPESGPNVVEAQARAKVEAENRAAAYASDGLSDLDARRVLSLRAAESLEGGRAALLRPERRRRLVELATRLGLRPFDANLVIAIVQDGARRGLSPDAPSTTATLALVPEPGAGDAARTRSTAGKYLALALTALLLAGLMMALAVQWLIAG